MFVESCYGNRALREFDLLALGFPFPESYVRFWTKRIICSSFSHFQQRSIRMPRTITRIDSRAQQSISVFVVLHKSNDLINQIYSFVSFRY